MSTISDILSKRKNIGRLKKMKLLANHCRNCKLLFEKIAMTSLAVQVTRERFRRCVSESLSNDGKSETHPDTKDK